MATDTIILLISATAQVGFVAFSVVKKHFENSRNATNYSESFFSNIYKEILFLKMKDEKESILHDLLTQEYIGNQKLSEVVDSMELKMPVNNSGIGKTTTKIITEKTEAQALNIVFNKLFEKEKLLIIYHDFTLVGNKYYYKPHSEVIDMLSELANSKNSKIKLSEIKNTITKEKQQRINDVKNSLHAHEGYFLFSGMFNITDNQNRNSFDLCWDLEHSVITNTDINCEIIVLKTFLSHFRNGKYAEEFENYSKDGMSIRLLVLASKTTRGHDHVFSFEMTPIAIIKI